MLSRERKMGIGFENIGVDRVEAGLLGRRRDLHTVDGLKRKRGLVEDARGLKQLEDENRCLKRLVADQALDIQMLKAVHLSEIGR